jgi:hypothetical protein
VAAIGAELEVLVLTPAVDAGELGRAASGTELEVLALVDVGERRTAPSSRSLPGRRRRARPRRPIQAAARGRFRRAGLGRPAGAAEI